MSLSLEPEILQEWFAPFNLNFETFTDLPTQLQADLLRFLLPEEAEARIDEKTRTALYFLGWTIGKKISGKSNSKSIWRVLFNLFLVLNEHEPATFAFSNIWPMPEPSKITYFSELVQLHLAQGNLEAAGKTIAEMQGIFPGRYTTLVTQAEFFLYQQNLVEARAAYLECLETSPFSHRLLSSLAEVSYKQNQIEEAIAWLEEAERQFEDRKNLSLKAARLWNKLEVFDKAAKIYENYALFREEKQNQLCEKVQKAAQENDHLSFNPDHANFELNQESISTAEDPDLAKFFSLHGESGQPTEVLPQPAYQALKEVFGYDEFRPGQEQVIANVLAGIDTLAVLPTGAGKSLCYQLPALLLDRPVLVLSPLISLMKDQFDKLPPTLKEHTLIINSSLEPGEAARHLQQISQPGHSVRLIYAAPERLRQTPFINALRKGGLGLVVVDEAHCVTMWGNDFRPDYLFI